MKQVRQSAFETNSSSSHSITIAAGEYVPDLLYPDEIGILEIHTGEFGWEAQDYFDAATKAAYCLTWLKEGHPNRTEEQMFIDVLIRTTGALAVKFVPMFTPETKSQYDYHEWGYIDHQSGPGEGGALCAAWASEKTLQSFIFNPQSRLHTDNDNSPCPECRTKWETEWNS